MMLIRLASLARDFSPGDAETWEESAKWLWVNDRARMFTLLDDIAENGMRKPVLLGGDRRVWDGHHRIVLATVLGWKWVPVQWA